MCISSDLCLCVFVSWCQTCLLLFGFLPEHHSSCVRSYKCYFLWPKNSMAKGVSVRKAALMSLTHHSLCKCICNRLNLEFRTNLPLQARLKCFAWCPKWRKVVRRNIRPLDFYFKKLLKINFVFVKPSLTTSSHTKAISYLYVWWEIWKCMKTSSGPWRTGR